MSDEIGHIKKFEFRSLSSDFGELSKKIARITLNISNKALNTKVSEGLRLKKREENEDKKREERRGNTQNSEAAGAPEWKPMLICLLLHCWILQQLVLNPSKCLVNHRRHMPLIGFLLLLECGDCVLEN